MKLINKQIKIILFLLSLTLLFSCDDDINDTKWGNSLIYMPQASIVDGGINNDYPVPLEIHPSVNNYTLDEETNSLQIILGVYRSGLEHLKKYSVEVSANIDETLEFIKGNDRRVLLPEETYTLPSEINVEDGERGTVFYLTVDLNKIIEDYPGFGEKDICLTIEISNPSNYELNEDLSKTNVIINGNTFLPDPPSLSVSPSSVKAISNKGEDITFTIDSNDDNWEYSIEDNPGWILEKKKTVNSLVLTVNKNTHKAREASITFNLTNYPSVSQVVKIDQEDGSPVNLIVTPEDPEIISSIGGDITFTIDSDNADWEYIIQDNPTWVTEVSKTATSLIFSISENTGTVRKANIIFSLSSAPEVKQEVEIVQEMSLALNLIKGGDMSEGSLDYWNILNLKEDASPYPNAVILEDGLMKYSVGDGSVNEYTGIVQEVELVEGKKYKLSLDFTSTGGANDAEIYLGIGANEPVNGDWYSFSGTDHHTYLGAYKKPSHLIDGYSGSYIPATEGRTNIDSDGIFTSSIDGKAYFVIFIGVYSGHIGTLTFDNITLAPLD